jgi:hypothetical protein
MWHSSNLVQFACDWLPSNSRAGSHLHANYAYSGCQHSTKPPIFISASKYLKFHAVQAETKVYGQALFLVRFGLVRQSLQTDFLPQVAACCRSQPARGKLKHRYGSKLGALLIYMATKMPIYRKRKQTLTLNLHTYSMNI